MAWYSRVCFNRHQSPLYWNTVWWMKFSVQIQLWDAYYTKTSYISMKQNILHFPKTLVLNQYKTASHPSWVKHEWVSYEHQIGNFWEGRKWERRGWFISMGSVVTWQWRYCPQWLWTLNFYFLITYTYIYINMHIYIHAYIYTHTHISPHIFFYIRLYAIYIFCILFFSLNTMSWSFFHIIK